MFRIFLLRIKLLFILSLISSPEIQAQTNWSYLPNAPIAQSTIGRFEDVFFIDGNKGWIVSTQNPDYVFKTNDGGNNWASQLLPNLPSAGCRSVEFLNENIGFIGSVFNYLFKTIDGGVNWYRIDSLLPGADSLKAICGMSHYGTSSIYGVGAWFQGGYFFKSNDAGNSWTRTDLSTTAKALVECLFLDSLTGFISGRANDSLNEGIILKTIDGGVTWNTVTLTHRSAEYVWKMQFLNNNLGYASIENTAWADSSYILKTIDGGNTWTKKFITSINFNMEGIGFVNDSVGFVGGWSNGMYKTSNGGDTWNFYNFGNNVNRIFMVQSGLAYAVGSTVYKWNEGFGTEIIPFQFSNKNPNELLLCYPNPSNQSMRFDFSNDATSNISISVFKADGKFISEIINRKFSAGVHSINWNCSNISSGEYFISFGTDLNYEVQKVFVIH